MCMAGCKAWGVEREYTSGFDLSEYVNSTYAFPYGDGQHARFVMDTGAEIFHFAPFTEEFTSTEDLLFFLDKYAKDRSALLGSVDMRSCNNL